MSLVRSFRFMTSLTVGMRLFLSACVLFQAATLSSIFFLKNALFVLKHKYLTTNKCPVEETCRQLWPWRVKSRTGVRGEA